MNTASTNPYVGLRPYEADESILFFGRDEQTIELLQRLHKHHFVAVVGSSGCGKSSLLRAGLIPALKAGYLVEDSDRWMIGVTKPGHSPIYNLAETLLLQIDPETTIADISQLATQVQEEGVDALLNIIAQLREAKKLNFFLLVDQFEELFRFAMEGDDGAKKDEAIDFVNIMLELSEQSVVPVYVVMTMRSDFIGDCAHFFGLPEAMNKSLYLVPKLNRQQLKRVIESPAKLFGSKVNPALSSRLLNDLGKVEDELPLLQHALMRIWEFEMEVDKSGELDLQDYEKIGGIEKALSFHAEEALKGMSDADKLLTKKIFQALTAIDENGRKIRRPVMLSELKSLTAATVEKLSEIINRFIGDKRSFLLVNKAGNTDDKVIDISHESLIRQWTTLNKWVDEEHESAAVYLQLHDAARQNKEGRKDFLAGSELQFAIEWYEQNNPSAIWGNRYQDSFDASINYLLASEKERVRQLNLRKARKRKQRFLVIAITIIISLILVASVYIYQISKINEQLEYSRKNLEEYTLKTTNFSRDIAKLAMELDSAQKTSKQFVVDLNKYISQDLESLSEADSDTKKKIIDRLNYYLEIINNESVKSQRKSQLEKNREKNDTAILIMDKVYSWTHLQKLMSNALEDSIKKFVYGFNNSSYSAVINNPKRFAAFISLVSYESNELQDLETSYDLSSSILLKTERYRHLFPRSIVDSYARQPEMIANRIHAGENGNGDELSGDGWRYRRRGIFKISAKNRYLDYSLFSNYNLIYNPDMLSSIIVATDIACIAWTLELGGDEGVNQIADSQNIEKIELLTKKYMLSREEKPPYTLSEYYSRWWDIINTE